MKISAIAQISEHMFFCGERLLPDPGDPFAPHMAEGFGLAVHPDAHVMAADTRQGTGSIRHTCGRIMRAARTKPRFALGIDNLPGFALALSLDHGHTRRNARPDVGR